MSEIKMALLKLSKLSRDYAFDEFQRNFEAKVIVGSHTSHVAILDDTAIVFSPTDDYNKVALSTLEEGFPHAPQIKLVMMTSNFNVFQAPVYKFLGDEEHKDYKRLRTLSDKILAPDLFDHTTVYKLLNRSRNHFLFTCSRILKHIMSHIPNKQEYQFYFDVQPQNVAVDDNGQLLAYDLFNIERIANE